MANWNSNDGFRQQKKRNFIYKSATQNKIPAVNSERNLTGSHMTNVINTISSPRKKMKSSYSFYDKSRTDQQAVEELCSDLPPDAFEDDVMDDFGDDLTAEELSEAASVAEQTEQTFGVSKDRQTENNTKDQLAQQSNKGFDEDYFGDFDQDLELVENETLLVQNDFTSHFPFSSKGDEAKVKELATESTAVLFSADSHSTNHFASTCTNIGFNNGDRSNSAFTNSANGFGVERKSSDQINLLQEKLQKREQKVKELEEQNYEKDGNLKMLQDSLVHLKSEETKNREKWKRIEEENGTQIKELKKTHEKNVEQLNSKICFQTQEIKQAKEQRQARQHLTSERESPKRTKSHKLSDNSFIPTGHSFFEKSLTESRSPKLKKVSKAQKSAEKNPETLKPSATCTKEEVSSRTLEKKLLKMNDSMSTKGRNVEVLQKLFRLPNTELADTCRRYETTPFNQSLLSLLRLNLNVAQTELGKREGGIDLGCVMLDQDGLNTTILNSEFKSKDVKEAIEGIQAIIDSNHSLSKTDESYLPLVNNFKASNFLDSTQTLKSAVSLLPLLERHISRYAEMRVDKDEDSLVSTCSPSSPGDLAEVKDKDTAIALSLAFDGAVQSLRCLDVLVLYSDEVCEVLLKSVRMHSNEEEKVQEAGTVQNDASLSSELSQGETSDLLSLLFQLVVPQPNEPSVVSLVSLGVIRSLAENCPQEHLTWFLPHLCDVLLPQCLSKEYGLSTLSLVIPILTKSLCGQHVCCQSDDCLLLKVYQGCLGDSVDLPHTNRISLQLKVVMLVENFMSSNNEALPYLAECHCSIELLKLLVCLLDKEVVFLQQFPLESLMNNPKTSCSVLLLRRGIFLLASFVTYSNRLLADLRMLVGHKYNNLIISSLRLLNGLKDIPENEVLIDLLDFENIEDSEVLGEDGVEDMEVGE